MASVHIVGELSGAVRAPAHDCVPACLPVCLSVCLPACLLVCLSLALSASSFLSLRVVRERASAPASQRTWRRLTRLLALAARRARVQTVAAWAAAGALVQVGVDGGGQRPVDQVRVKK